MSEEIQKLKDRIMYFESRILDLNKELDIAKEEIQAQNLAATSAAVVSEKRENELLNISKAHQKDNGELRERLSRYENKANHYRRKGVI